MYDNLVCDMPLPGKRPAWLKAGHAFQSKSLDCTMETYTIAADGAFSVPDFTGTVDFHWSNVVGSGPGIYTRDGEDAEHVEYQAVIVGGRVTRLEQTSYSAHAAWPASKQQMDFPRPTVEQVAAVRARRQQNWVGHRLYVLWGGQEKGYWVKVLARSERELCVEIEETDWCHHKGDLELLAVADIDRLIWESDVEALAQRSAEHKQWAAEVAEWESFLAQHGGVRA